MRRTCACVVGWHFPEPMLASLAGSSNLDDVFLLSHRPARAIPEFVTKYVPSERILVQPNLGYDWGAYQQFLEHGIHRDYEVVFLLHDDLEFRESGWVEACVERLDAGYAVVGNGRYDTLAGPDQTAWCYAPSRWKPPSRAFQHSVVRGSFLATTSQSLGRIGSFEVFWDWMHLSVGFGNWSLRATCGKIQALFGDRSFAFLGESSLESRYMRELERGGNRTTDGARPRGLRGAAYDARRLRRLKAYVIDAYRLLCSRYMDYYFDGNRRMCQRLQPLVNLPALRARS